MANPNPNAFGTVRCLVKSLCRATVCDVVVFDHCKEYDTSSIIWVWKDCCSGVLRREHRVEQGCELC